MFELNNYKCAACGRQFEADEKGLQADHRVPLVRGGTSDIENWQPLCTECNVSKRRSCQQCEADCDQCAWAYPEEYGAIVAIRLDASLLQLLHREAAKKGLHFQDLAAQYIEQALKNIR